MNTKAKLSQKALKVKESSTLAITARAKAMKASGASIISFSVGEPDFDTPAHVGEAAVAAVKAGFTKYTASSGIPELRSAICEKLENENGLIYKPSQIVVSNGAKHAISNALAALLNDGDEVIIPAPYWLTYPELVVLHGGVPVIVKTDKTTGYKASATQIEAAVTDRTKALFINSPNNPSGAVYNKTELEAIAKIAVKHDIFVISDEIYEKLIYGDDMPHVSIASFGKDIFERTIVINGYSKSHAMTGWRAGYTASVPEIAEVIGNIQSHQTSNVCSIAQKAALAAQIGGQGCVDEMRKQFLLRRDYMSERVAVIPGFDALVPDGAFYVFVDVSKLYGKKTDGAEISNAAVFAAELLEKKGVAIVPCADFGYDTHIRLSYAASMDDIKEGMDRIEAFVKDLK